MLAIDLKDENGDPLSIPGEVTISVTSEQIGNVTTENGISNIKFWRLSPFTGSWEFVADVVKSEEKTRKKRQITGDTRNQDIFTTTIRGISVETEWYNFDYIYDATCFSKIRVFESSEFIEDNQIHDATVGVIVEDSSNNLKSLSRLRARTDFRSDHSGGYCIGHPCITGSQLSEGNVFTAYFFADYNGKEMKPATVNTGILESFKQRIDYTVLENTIRVAEVSSETAEDGPYYQLETWQSSQKCSSAPFTENHFRFYDDTSCFQSYTALETPIPGAECTADNFLLWHSPTTQLLFQVAVFKYRVCFVKVGLESISPLPMKIRVTSKEKVPRKDGNSRSMFGTRDGCNENIEKTVCLEVKDPSRIGCNDDPTNDITSSSITIVIEGVNTERYQVSEISSGLQDHHADEIDRRSNTVSIDISAGSNYGTDYGIYCGESEDGDESGAYGVAENKCKTSGGTDGGWAVKFTGIITWFLFQLFPSHSVN